VALACEGRVALVTGASKGGTGTAIAHRLAAEGAAVAICARDADGLARTQAQLRGLGATVLSIQVDLSDPDGGRATLVERVVAELGRLDIVVNNAAANGYRPFREWTARRLELTQQVNVWAPWQLMADASPGMVERGEGWILNITSHAAEAPPGPPFPQSLAATAGSGYGVTKAALNRLTVSVAAELWEVGVRVNALAPQSAIATPHLVAAGGIREENFEPMETMAEAALALVTGGADRTGSIWRSLQLLVELDRPVLDLDGRAEVPGWQPADLRPVIERQRALLAERGWPDAF
jgi:NAD(P)-dependent dehydrogenase (short-subunit alcohol dehydrogenase family)